MKRVKKIIASLAMASMTFTMVPFNAFAAIPFPTRLAGVTATQTAVKIADQTGWTGTAILSSSTPYGMVDALTAGPLAKFLSAPILLQDAANTLNIETKTELIKLNITTVYVTSGTAVISQGVIDELKGMNITVVPLGGFDRFATSANIAQKMVALGATVSKAAVVYGWLNQDALSIASIASAQTEPILLTEKSTIPASVQAFFTANTSITTTDLIGGIGVISDAVKAQLPSATRIFGITAYDTNVAVLKAFNSVLNYAHVFVANGETAIDALTGAPLAAQFNAGIFLTNGSLNEGTAYARGKQTASSVATALGGTAVVPDSVLAGLVFVPDTTPPVIQLIGSNPAPANQVVIPTQVTGANGYVDPGTVAIDNLDGNLTASVTVAGTVNTAIDGAYPLTYTVTDAAGNSASIARTVNVVGRMDPLTITKSVTPLLIPWAIPKSVDPNPTANTDYYEIAMKQFVQQVLPAGLPKTTVWGYGSATDPTAVFNAPSLTIEATANKPVRIKWINGLKDANGNYLPHLLPNDQTISSWPNPAGGMPATPSQASYVGPVPIVTHVHGSHVVQESDGYPTSWYLPATTSIPMGYATEGPQYAPYKTTAQSGANWTAGNAVFDYTNDQRANTIWYHDHAMGFTRTNVYAGPAGFYLIRGGAGDVVTNSATNLPAVLPGPAPLTMAQYAASIPTGSVYEIPIAIQDRSFNTDGSLFYPGSRAEFDGFTGPYAPTTDVAPIWNPEFFGDTIIVNGSTWPTLNVQPKKYRLRFLNGANARTFILSLKNMRTTANLPIWQIGTDGGFLAAPTNLNELLMMPAERADVIVDFSTATVGDSIILANQGPDAPYQGGLPDPTNPPLPIPAPAPGYFTPANPATTGQVMEFKVVATDGTADLSTNPSLLVLPAVTPLVPTATAPVRKLSLNEVMSTVIDPLTGMSIGPVKALLGTATNAAGVVSANPLNFMDVLTENIKLNDTETWEIYNFTADAHPIHLHLVDFQVVDRQLFDPATGLVSGAIIPTPTWENGYKDTVMALPGQVTRIRAKFDIAGLYVWHCHILEHEENEMMRPYLVK